MNRCDLCEQDKDEAILLVQGRSNKRKVCGTCAWAVAQSLAACRALERSYDDREDRNDALSTALRQILNSARPGRA
ncbi:MAG TPA: hypothetical protein VJY65_05590 [Chloroflexota bacterium]|jgi:hypothetical protein|nr:hypothetical protein [Chloroflexota bacterium]